MIITACVFAIFNYPEKGTPFFMVHRFCKQRYWSTAVTSLISMHYVRWIHYGVTHDGILSKLMTLEEVTSVYHQHQDLTIYQTTVRSLVSWKISPQRTLWFLISSDRVLSVYMSLKYNSPPSFNTRNASYNTAFLSLQRFMTQFDL